VILPRIVVVIKLSRNAAALLNMVANQENGALGDRARKSPKSGDQQGGAGSPSTPLRMKSGHIENCFGGN
jgi:hypothetical protein